MGISGDSVVPRGSCAMDGSVIPGGTPVDDVDNVVVCICDETYHCYIHPLPRCAHCQFLPVHLNL